MSEKCIFFKFVGIKIVFIALSGLQNTFGSDRSGFLIEAKKKKLFVITAKAVGQIQSTIYI